MLQTNYTLLFGQILTGEYVNTGKPSEESWVEE